MTPETGGNTAPAPAGPETMEKDTEKEINSSLTEETGKPRKDSGSETAGETPEAAGSGTGDSDGASVPEYPYGRYEAPDVPVRGTDRNGPASDPGLESAAAARLRAAGVQPPSSGSLYGTVPDRTRKRRRAPKRRRFLRGMIIFAAAALAVIAAGGIIFWRIVGMKSETGPDAYMRDLVSNTDAAGWRQLIKEYFPKGYTGCEDASRLASEVLAPAFEPGKITYLKNSYSGAEGTYDIFSDGRRFATVTLEKNAGGTGWKTGDMDFPTGFFTSVEFPAVRVQYPRGAELTVNGKKPETGETAGCVYFDLKPGDDPSAAPCEERVFDDLYFEPVITASLDGTGLEAVRDGQTGVYRFRYPASATHSISVTAPAGVTVTVGGAELDGSWAGSESVEGPLGELDDGGTGTRPTLTVWTVDGLFGQPEVAAEIYGRSLTPDSSDGGNYVFGTPPECKYTVTVTVPAGSSVRINGRDAGEASKVAGGPTAADLGGGGTMLGRYSVYELASVPQAFPAFDKYVFTGYLAVPRVEAELDGRALEPASFRVSAYDVFADFDFLPASAAETDPGRVDAAKAFASDYIRYICEGGAWDNRNNADRFNANYGSLIGKMIEGTAGYVNMMESYREVFMMKPCSGYELTDGGIREAGYIRYTDSCVSCRLEFSVLRRYGGAEDGEPAGPGNGGTAEEPKEELVEAEMNILEINYGGEWRVWGFTYGEKTAGDARQAANQN